MRSGEYIAVDTEASVSVSGPEGSSVRLRAPSNSKIRYNQANMVSPWLKTGILIALCTQNASYTLLRKLSTMTTTVNSKEILLVGEILKLVVSGGFVIVSKEPSSSKGEGVSKLLWVAIHSGKMFVLAGIYLVMNVLSFVSLQYIGAGMYMIYIYVRLSHIPLSHCFRRIHCLRPIKDINHCEFLCDYNGNEAIRDKVASFGTLSRWVYFGCYTWYWTE